MTDLVKLTDKFAEEKHRGQKAPAQETKDEGSDAHSGAEQAPRKSLIAC